MSSYISHCNGREFDAASRKIPFVNNQLALVFVPLMRERVARELEQNMRQK